MSEILVELGKLTQVAQEQTAACQAQTAEVAGKMGEIDEKVAEAETQFENFISGDFELNVARALEIRVYIDPVDGDDTNSGSSSTKAIKSSLRLAQIVGSNTYQWVTLYFRNGTNFYLEHNVSARTWLALQPYTGSDNSSTRPEVYQHRPNSAMMYAQKVHVSGVNITTYRAAANEELPLVYVQRSFFNDSIEISFIFSKVTIVDNQLIHLHTGGSGERFVRHTISLYHSTFATLASADGVVGSNKVVTTFYAVNPAYPFDIFGIGFAAEYHDPAATHASIFNIKKDGVLTNLPLFPVE